MLSPQRVSVGGIHPPSAFGPSEEVSRHKCLIYEGDPSEQLPVVVPFLLDGLRNNWRCLYVGNPRATKMVEQALAREGVSTARETKRKALIFSSERDHLSGGTFDPRAMVEWLSRSVDEAVQDGYEGLCATGDMRWELGPDDNFEYLAEYEARLEQLFRTKALRGICLYHRDILPAAAARNALAAHRSVYMGRALKPDNFFYIPPELILERESSGAEMGAWMCEQIMRVVNAESARDQAMAALRESEMQQRQLAEQLAEANRDLESRVQERTSLLQQANQELEAFSYSVSHDLRSPLQHISGFATLLAEDCGQLDDKSRDYVRRIQSGTKDMAELINDLLRLAKLAQAELQIGKVQLSVIAQNVVSALRFGHPGRRVEVKIEPNLEVEGDAGLLRAAIENLFSNAWKYTARSENPVIEFGSITEGGGRTYFVRDNGAGFEMRHADRLFAPFQRMHRDDEFAGHGVGLATVQRIILRHHGKIWAEAETGKGATFYFTLGSRVTGASGVHESARKSTGQRASS